MRHIKLFEGYLDEPEYKELTTEEYENIIEDYLDLADEFTPQEFNWINNNYRNKHWYPGGLTDIKGMDNISVLNVRISLPPNSYIHIYKLKDDWFLVNYHYLNYHRHTLQKTMYKCDKLDGLIKLIEDKKLKVNYIL